MTIRAVGLVLCVAGCGGTPSAPSAGRMASDNPIAPTESHWQISGVITEISSGRPVSDVLVAVRACNTGLGVISDSTGRYTIDKIVFGPSCSGPGTITLSSIGFETQAGPIDTSSPVTANFSLTPIATSTMDLSGRWTLTVSAATACAGKLPAAARERRFDATLTQVGVRVVTTLEAPAITVLSEPVGGTGTFIDGVWSSLIIGDTGPIVNGDIVWTYPDFFEWLSPTEAVAVVGAMRGTFVRTEIRGSLNGDFEYWGALDRPSVLGPPSAVCHAEDHPFVLRRQP